jgi:hypothetical protein
MPCYDFPNVILHDPETCGRKRVGVCFPIAPTPEAEELMAKFTASAKKVLKGEPQEHLIGAVPRVGTTITPDGKVHD